jgi:haloacetate dehalogenase
VRAAYVNPLRDPARVHAICEEYRAAATLDLAHDQADRNNGRRIASPLLLWSASGALDDWYAEAGGPRALWRDWADEVQGGPASRRPFLPGRDPGRNRRRSEPVLLRGFLSSTQCALCQASQRTTSA